MGRDMEIYSALDVPPGKQKAMPFFFFFFSVETVCVGLNGDSLPRAPD